MQKAPKHGFELQATARSIGQWQRILLEYSCIWNGLTFIREKAHMILSKSYDSSREAAERGSRRLNFRKIIQISDALERISERASDGAIRNVAAEAF